MEVACRWNNVDDIHDRLLRMREACAIPARMDTPARYFCRECNRGFDDLGSLTAHMEQSTTCPSNVASQYFKRIIAVANCNAR